MKIVIDTLPGTASQEEIDFRCRKFQKEGKYVKTRRNGNEIEIYIEEIFED